MKLGIYTDITNDEYHFGEGVSKSLLDLVHKSPAHYRAAIEAKNDNEPTPDQAIGSAFHSLLLEPDLFATSYVVAPKVDRRTKDGKAQWEAFQIENAGKELLDQAAFEQLAEMADATKRHPAALALLTGSPGRAESSAYWVDPHTELLCRCRPDFWREDGIIVDFKTTADASPEEFARSIAKWRYHVQAAYYLDGLAETIRQSAAPVKIPTAFVFLVVEKKSPFSVAAYVLSAESIEIGRAEYRADLDKLAECIRTGNYPGYSDKIEPISLPAWYFKKSIGE